MGSPTTTTSLFTSLHEDLSCPSSTMGTTMRSTTMWKISSLVEYIRNFGFTDVTQLHAWYVHLICMNLARRPLRFEMSINGILCEQACVITTFLMWILVYY